MRPTAAAEVVTWLAKQTHKAILKLTEHDYAEHQLTSLVARHGSPGAVNGLVFNALGERVQTHFTDWKGEHEQVDDVCVILIRL